MFTAGLRKPTIRWILANGPQLARGLEVSLQEILDQHQAELDENSPLLLSSDTTISKAILQAVAELDHPTFRVINRLRKIEATTGIELDYDSCKALLANLLKVQSHD